MSNEAAKKHNHAGELTNINNNNRFLEEQQKQIANLKEQITSNNLLLNVVKEINTKFNDKAKGPPFVNLSNEQEIKVQEILNDENIDETGKKFLAALMLINNLDLANNDKTIEKLSSIISHFNDDIENQIITFIEAVKKKINLDNNSDKELIDFGKAETDKKKKMKKQFEDEKEKNTDEIFKKTQELENTKQEILVQKEEINKKVSDQIDHIQKMTEHNNNNVLTIKKEEIVKSLDDDTKNENRQEEKQQQEMKEKFDQIRASFNKEFPDFNKLKIVLKPLTTNFTERKDILADLRLANEWNPRTKADYETSLKQLYRIKNILLFLKSLYNANFNEFLTNGIYDLNEKKQIIDELSNFVTTLINKKNKENAKALEFTKLAEMNISGGTKRKDVDKDLREDFLDDGINDTWKQLYKLLFARMINKDINIFERFYLL